MFSPPLAPRLPRRVRVRLLEAEGHLVVDQRLKVTSSLYDVLGALGLPPCEVGPVARFETGTVADPAAPVEPGARYAVAAVEPRDLADPRFLADLHLGKLVRLLRVLSIDTLWERSGDEAVMAERAVAEGRLVLSRNRALLKRRALRRAMLVLSDHPDRQALEVLRRFRLAPRVTLFGRCSRCNGRLDPVAKEKVADRIPPKTAAWLDAYYLCRDCDQLFWEGTHVTALRRRAEAILATLDTGSP